MAPKDARRWVAALALALLVAGCTSAPPTEPPNDPRQPRTVTLTPGATAVPGASVTFTWDIQGGSDSYVHSDLHYGPDPVPESPEPKYPETRNGDLLGRGQYTASVPMPASGQLCARAHVVGFGRQVVSNEVCLQALDPNPRFRDVRVPDSPPAGASFTLAYRVEGQGNSTHVGAHFSQESSANLARNFAPGDWKAARASQHLGVPTPVAFPAAVEVSVVLPTPGTWYLRPHAIRDGVHHWGEELALVAVNPAAPNVVVLSAPASAVAGSPATVTFAVNAQPGVSGHVGAHYSMNSSAGQPPGFPPVNWSGQRATVHHGTEAPVPVPGTFTVNITFPLPGLWRFRAHAIVGNQHVWAEEMAVAVAPPAEARVLVVGVNGDPASPTDHSTTGGIGPGGASLGPVVVEWAVLTPVPGSTGHTRVHHGPNSVASPSERPQVGAPAYTGATSPQQGNTSGLFRAEFTPPLVDGPYYLRAVAMVLDAQGQPREVWSEEWVVHLRARP